MKEKAKILTGLSGRMLAILPLAGFLSACGLVREDLPACPSPVVELRFVYDYNMEFANAFHNQVDCLSAYIFDNDGFLVAMEKVTDRALLSDEDWRMRPELPEGDYHVIAYGGMDCEQSSFSRTTLETGSRKTDLHVQLHPACLTDDARRRLHNHYYGAAEFSVRSEEDTRATVSMMRNTNSIQVALQHLDGSPVDCNDFTFEIADDNNDFDHENNLLATGEITYKPWNTDNRGGGDEEDTPSWNAALAQFTTSRLVLPTAANGKQTGTSLHVRRASDGETVFRIPLLYYMLLFKHDNSGAGLDGMGDQEYLDRENSWNFVFFLDNNNFWVRTRLVINDWEVRLNGTDM